MALSDYRLCDVCGGKTFYDSNLSYDFDEYPDNGLSGVGDWAVLCRDCAKTHQVVVFASDEGEVYADALEAAGAPISFVERLRRQAKGGGQ
jgi:hypothetical protein